MLEDGARVVELQACEGRHDNLPAGTFLGFLALSSPLEVCGTAMALDTQAYRASVAIGLGECLLALGSVNGGSISRDSWGHFLSPADVSSLSDVPEGDLFPVITTTPIGAAGPRHSVAFPTPPGAVHSRGRVTVPFLNSEPPSLSQCAPQLHHNSHLELRGALVVMSHRGARCVEIHSEDGRSLMFPAGTLLVGLIRLSSAAASPIPSESSRSSQLTGSERSGVHDRGGRDSPLRFPSPRGYSGGGRGGRRVPDAGDDDSNRPFLPGSSGAGGGRGGANNFGGGGGGFDREDNGSGTVSAGSTSPSRVLSGLPAFNIRDLEYITTRVQDVIEGGSMCIKFSLDHFCYRYKVFRFAADVQERSHNQAFCRS